MRTEVVKMGTEIEKLKLKTSEDKLKSIAMNQLTQQCAELCRSEDNKIPELEGDVGILHKTHNVYQSTSAGTSKVVRKNMNLNKLFDKPYTPNTSKDPMFIPPQITTYRDSL